MKAWPLTALALVATPTLAFHQESAESAREEPFALVDQRNPTWKLDARPNEEAIKQAIRDTLAERKDDLSSASGTALSGGAYRAFERQFSQARKAHCLGPDPLKHQPHSFETKDWAIGVGGIFAAPFWAAAIVRGKCNWRR